MNNYILELNHLKKYYGNSRGIEDVTIKLNKGDIYGFIGPNGSGKSTTIRTIIGLINKTAGKIYIKVFAIRRVHVRAPQISYGLEIILRLPIVVIHVLCVYGFACCF